MSESPVSRSRDEWTHQWTPPRHVGRCATDAFESQAFEADFGETLHVAHWGYILSSSTGSKHNMAKTATVRARVEPKLKAKAEVVLGRLGLSPTQAITLYYEQIIRQRAVPFAIALPNAATRRAMRDAEKGRHLTQARNTAALIAALDSDE